MDIYLRGDAYAHDDTIDPAYLKNRLRAPSSGGGTVDDETVQQLRQSINSLSSRTTSLETKVNQQAQKITSFDESQRQQDLKISDLDTRVTALEESQEAQDKQITDINDEIEEIKEQLNNIGTTTTIVNYITSVIGMEVPEEAKNDPDKLAEWLAEQDEDGIDLASLAKRIKDIETNILTDDDISDIVNGGH